MSQNDKICYSTLFKAQYHLYHVSNKTPLKMHGEIL